MNTKNLKPRFTVILLTVLSVSLFLIIPLQIQAAGDSDVNPACASLEQTMKDILDQNAYNVTITTDPAFTLLMERSDGRVFSYSHDDTQAVPVVISSPTTPYESASTSKLVSAVIILRLVDQGYLSLTAKAHDVIKNVVVTNNLGIRSLWTWPDTTVTLQYLLSFLSGFWDGSDILSCPNLDFAYCVKSIYEANTNPTPAGSQFYYSSTHLQIAGLMAMAATGKPWANIFADFQEQTGLFPNSAYNLPSTTNPRLAGGMTWTAEDYLVFLKALYWNKTPKGDKFLSDDLRQSLFANQRGSATVTSSPAGSPLVYRLGEDWAYGFGNWLECRSPVYSCGEGHRNSSPGAYGAYPFIDFDYGYFGILARQSTGTGTFPEGVNLFRTIQSYASQWSQMTCDTTPPLTPVVTDEGQYTNKTTQLYAQWTSSDFESGIADYKYKITTQIPVASYDPKDNSWIPTQGYNYVTAGALNLETGKTYYFAVVAINGAGLWSAIGYSNGITVDNVPPLTANSGIDNLWHNNSITVTLTATDSGSGVSKTYYSTNGTNPTIIYTGPFILTDSGVYTIKYYSVDKAANTEVVKTAANQAKIDKVVPAGSILINNDAAYTKSTAVTLNLSAADTGGSGLSSMQFSNDGVNYSTAEAYAVAKSWTLASGSGTKTVYVKFKDNAGNWSIAYSDTIKKIGK